MASKVLAITGMHRSGTSLVAEYLSECGLFVGDSLIDGGVVSTTSRAGHHEDKEFLDWHDSILNKKKIPVFLTDETLLPILVDRADQEAAQKLLEKRKEIPQWGWKDPRTTLFVDFWNDLIEDIQFLFLFRHPLSVVDSLIRRGKNKIILQKPVIALRAWIIYNQKILDFYADHPTKSLIYEIDTFVSHPTSLHQALLEKFAIHLNEISLEHVFSKDAFNSHVSADIEALKKQHNDEVSAAIHLYQEIQTISAPSA